MKAKDMHNGMDRKELRDFFSLSISRTYQKEAENKISLPSSSDYPDSLEWMIRRSELELKFWKKDLEINKERYSLVTLMKSQGWSDHDVSDQIGKDLESGLFLNFIGTKQEYQLLLTEIEQELAK